MAAQQQRPARHEMPAIPPEFIVQYQGKDYITAAGLTYLGHLQGLKRVDVQIVQAPTKDSITTIVRCEVETDLGVFSDYGEVSSGNRNAVAKEYPVSMASTRARNRALRIATKCPLSSYEEMGIGDGDEEVPRGGQNRQQQKAQPDQPSNVRTLPPTQHPDQTTPADQGAYDSLVNIAAELCNLTGEIESIPDELTVAGARRLFVAIREKVKAAQRQQAQEAAEMAELTGEPLAVAGAVRLEI